MLAGKKGRACGSILSEGYSDTAQKTKRTSRMFQSASGYQDCRYSNCKTSRNYVNTDLPDYEAYRPDSKPRDEMEGLHSSLSKNRTLSNRTHCYLCNNVIIEQSFPFIPLSTINLPYIDGTCADIRNQSIISTKLDDRSRFLKAVSLRFESPGPLDLN